MNCEVKSRHRPSKFYTFVILCAVAPVLGAYIMLRRTLNAFAA